MADDAAARTPTSGTQRVYPHGDARRYRYNGCHCERCCRADARKRKARQYRKIAGIPAPTDMVDAVEAVARIREMAKEYRPADIGRATGMANRHLRRIISGYTPQKVRRSTAEAVRRATPRHRYRNIPHDRLRLIVYSLAALGYPVVWLEKEMGLPKNLLWQMLAKGVKTDEETMATAERLYEDLRRVPADKYDPSLSPRILAVAKAAADRNGYKTPDWYDEDGRQLLHREWRYRQLLAKRHETAEQRIEVIRQALNGAQIKEISDRTGVACDTVTRYIRQVGLEFQVSFAGDRIPIGASRCRFKEVRGILNRHYANHDSDPYQVAMVLGMMTERKWRHEASPKLNPAARKAA